MEEEHHHPMARVTLCMGLRFQLYMFIFRRVLNPCKTS